MDTFFSSKFYNVRDAFKTGLFANLAAVKIDRTFANAELASNIKGRTMGMPCEVVTSSDCERVADCIRKIH